MQKNASGFCYTEPIAYETFKVFYAIGDQTKTANRF